MLTCDFKNLEKLSHNISLVCFDSESTWVSANSDPLSLPWKNSKTYSEEIVKCLLLQPRHPSLRPNRFAVDL